MRTTILAFIVALAFASVGFVSSPPAPKASTVEWLTIEEAYTRNLKEPRKFLIDVYTDWCGWCKVMDRETFSNPKVAAYINQKYYAVKLNAEGRKPIKLGNNTFNFVPQGSRGYQELAAILMNGKMSYPTVVFMDEKFLDKQSFQVIQAIPGYLKAPEFHRIMTFFGDNYHKGKMPWDKYQTDVYPKREDRF